MAGDWIKVGKDLSDKPEVRRMARALGLSRYDIVGRLVAIWSWADTHSFSGSGMGITEEDIDDIADLNGFAVALRQVGWLQGRAAALEFPHFDRHNGQTAKRRAMDSSRKASEYRERSKCGANAENSPHEKRKKCGTEKRREEKEKHTTPILTDESSMQKEKPRCPEETGQIVRQRPKDAAEVREYMGGQVVRPPDDDGLSYCSAKFFDELEAVGWRNKNGIPLADWRPLARQYAASWARNEQASKQKKPNRRDALWTD